MGINVRVQKVKQQKAILCFTADMEKDLKECMRCKYFHGNNHRCIKEKCCEDMEKAETGKTIVSNEL